MRRRKRGLEDSFDLFLDTITNTFGGVLLIALLIVLMLRTPKESAPNENRSGSTEDLELIQSEITALESEKSAIETALTTQQQFETEFQSDEIRILASQLSKMMSQKIDLDLQESTMVREARQARTEIKNLKTEEGNLKQTLSSNQNEIKNLTDKVNHEKSLRTRTMRLPKEQATFKLEVPIVIEGNEIFIVNADLPGGGFSVNSEHIEVCSPSNADLNLDSKYLRVKNGHGIQVTDDRKVGQRFQKFDSSKHYFVFVVRTDSFMRFSRLREICVKMGFEYRLIPTDDLISEGGGTRAKAQ